MEDNSPTKTTEDSQPPKRDLNSFPVGTSRLTSKLNQPTVVRPFTSTSLVPKPKPTSSKGPLNLASSIKLVYENLAAKAQAAIEREGMKDLRSQNQSQAIVDVAQIKHQPFPLQTKAMKLFSQGEEEHFPLVHDRLNAAKVLREDSNAAFFVQLSQHLCWIWLKNELKKQDCKGLKGSNLYFSNQRTL